MPIQWVRPQQSNALADQVRGGCCNATLQRDPRGYRGYVISGLPVLRQLERVTSKSSGAAASAATIRMRVVWRARSYLRLVASLAVLLLSGCAYRLPPSVPPSQDRVRIVATNPEEFVLRIETETTAEIPVPADGGVTFSVPWYRRSCGVYLFNQIRVGGYGDPLQQWHVLVIHKGKVVRRLSLRQVQNLDADQAGYRVLNVRV